MAIVCLLKDRWVREIILTEECWSVHIVHDHPVLRGSDALVADAVTTPHRVMHDAEHEDRQVFYRLGRAPNVPRRLLHRYLKVCVEFGQSSSSRRPIHSPTTRAGRLVLARGMTGMTEQSAT